MHLFSRTAHQRSHTRSISQPTTLIESLEGRALFSASTIAADVLGADISVTPLNTPVVTESTTALVKIEGSYAGHYESENLGKDTIFFTITHDTHTGHFTGTFKINTLTIGTYTGSATGVIHANKHVNITISGSKVSGTFIGIASKTGGSFAGSYSVKSGSNTDTGTYHVGKA